MEAVRRDFQALWNTQFFEDIRLEVENKPRPARTAKFVIFYVTERPIIRRIEYKGNKSITESDILDAFKDKKVGLSVESQFDPTKIKRAEVVIKELAGRARPAICHGETDLRTNCGHERRKARLQYRRRPEGESRRRSRSSGNKAFSTRKIIRTMKQRPADSIPLYFTDIPVMGKTFDRPKLDEDLEVGIRGLYQDHGYFKAVVDVKDLKTVDDE